MSSFQRSAGSGQHSAISFQLLCVAARALSPVSCLLSPPKIRISRPPLLPSPVSRLASHRPLLPAALLLLPAIFGRSQPALAVTLRGSIESPSAITRIWAVNRVRTNPLAVSRGVLGHGKNRTPWVFPGTWNPQTHHFSIPHLVSGHHYDLIVWNKQGRWEGVNMNYYRLCTLQGKFTAADSRQIVRFITKIERFTNYNRPLWIAADHRHATVVVEQIRTTGFYSGHQGSIIFRVAVWYFQRFFGGWEKVSNMGIVLTRWRGPASEIPNPWQYLPALGGIHVKKSGRYTAIHIKLPAKASPHHGLDGAIP